TWQPINAFAVGKKYNGVIGSATLTVSRTGIVVDSVTAKDTLTLPSIGQFPVGTEIIIYDGTGNGGDSIYVTGGKTGGKQDSINASVTVLGINTAWGSVSFIAVPGNTNGIAAGIKSNGWIKK
ncbi:MAG: hypothetical protein KGJ13_10030, partial [Patescibacteria group bacterium]|nr:hypothetical protein [Patescibacteria group bacterium]